MKKDNRKTQRIAEKINAINVNCSTCNKQKVLEHQLDEWKTLNEYINQIDLNYQQSFVIMVSIFALIAGVITSNAMPKEMLKLIFIVPLGLVAVFSYLSYQFRITAILRGHLAALEDKMNETLEENVHMWNSALVESYMAHNNTINQNMMIPIVIFIILLVLYCLIFTWKALEGIGGGGVIFGVYWVLIAYGATIVLPPFFKNDEIRKRTYDEETVMKMYRNYVEQRDTDNKKSERQMLLLKKSIIPAIANLVLGFGAMYIFWCFDERREGLKGLFDYYAAVFGDALFLTMLIGAGCYFISANEQIVSKRAKKYIWGATISAMLIGMVLQVSWLLDDNIGLNWTLDRVHHFTIAGWYHALYFITMFGVITYISAKTIYLNHITKEKIKISYILVWLSGLGYWHMHLIDDCLTMKNYMVQIIFSLVVFVVAFFVVVVFKGVDVKKSSKVYAVYFVACVVMTIVLIAFVRISGLEWNVQELFEQIIQGTKI